MAKLRRRDFLVRCCQGASASLVPFKWAGLGWAAAMGRPAQASPSLAGEFHVHPHYRAQTPLDAILLKTSASQDDFISEIVHDRLAAFFADWSLELRTTPRGAGHVASVLAENFSGTSLRPASSRVLRSHGGVEAWKSEFGAARLDRDRFVSDVSLWLSAFAAIQVAEFQITGIELPGSTAHSAQSVQTVKTRMRYELAGPVSGFWREQRIGEWDMEWVGDLAGGFKISSWRAVQESEARAASAAFADITAEVLGGNASYKNQLALGVDHWRTVLDGASGIDIYGHNGIAVGDFDDDGFDDLYVCQPAGLPNRLYRNRGDGTFEDVTEESGLGILDNTACALFADVNNDGHQDLIVVRARGPLLFLNQGGGKFREQPDAFRFATPPQGTFTGAALADYDRDGWLDIYFCLYIYYQGTGQYKYPLPYQDAENGPPNFMMRNNRDGTFRDVTGESGLDKNNTRYSFCCGWNDFNEDGWPDLYVVNDFGRKNLYRNNGNGTFTDVASEAGVEDIGAGMSVGWADFSGDGREDLYVADMWTAAGERIASQDAFRPNAPADEREMYRKHAMGNSLFQNAGGGLFRDRTAPSGAGMGRWSWSSDAFDFDHDGFADLYVVNGMLTGRSPGPLPDDLNSFFWRQVVGKCPDVGMSSLAYEQGWSAINELVRSDGTWSGLERNVFYANNGDGTFADVSAVVGMDFVEDGRAFALSDFDHDGRLEVLLKNRNAPQVRILKNVMKELPASVSFRLRGTKSNRDAIGAAVAIETDKAKQTRRLQAGSGFLSQHTKELLFGLGEAARLLKVTVRWPSGLAQEFSGVPMGHRVTIEEGKARFEVEPFRAVKPRDSSSAPKSGEEDFPSVVETWLLEPVPAPAFSLSSMEGKTHTLDEFRGKPAVLCFWSTSSPDATATLALLRALQKDAFLQVFAIHVDGSGQEVDLHALVDERLAPSVARATEDVAAIYNLLFRYIYDRHRDLPFPTSFLVNEQGKIEKIYVGRHPAEKITQDAKSIPRSEAERLRKALPFPDASQALEYGRNYLSMGSVFFQRGYYDQAESWFQIASQNDANSAEAAYGLGSAYLKQEKADLARSNFQRATTLHAGYPDTLPDAWNNLGLMETREGHTEQAIQHFQQALRISPNHLVALENLGNAYRQLHRWDEGQRVLEKALLVSPEDAEATYSLGMIFAQTNDPERAYEYLQRALKYRPAYPEALNNLGILYLRRNEPDKAIASFRECMRVAPAFDQAYLNLARVLTIQGKAEEARAVLLDLLKQHPGHVEARKMLDQLPR